MVEIVKANDILIEARGCLEGKYPDGTPCVKNLRKAEELLNELLTNNIGNPTIIYILGSLYMEAGHFGLAIQLLSQVTQANPAFGEAWNNMGMAYRGANNFDKAVVCCKQAFKLLDHVDIPCNLSGLHLNRGMPEEGLKYADMALAKDPDHIKAQWHKAVALLELRRWGEAWPLHEVRLGGGANYNIAERNYHGPDGMTPWWDGEQTMIVEGGCNPNPCDGSHGPKGKLCPKGISERPALIVIHGEQGMGDEIMFGTCIKDAIATGANIFLEPSPRLEGLFRRTFPAATVYGTNETDGRDWIKGFGKPDFKCAIGSLPKFYRHKAEDFPGTPYLVPDPDKMAWWADKLKTLGDKPKIGLAWQGGVQSTRNDARSFHPMNFKPLFRHDMSWISLQYDSTAQANVADVKRELGVEITHWPKAVEATDPETGKPSDLDELAALISQLDLVISVPQTTYHFAGALGVPCLVLTPWQVDWRLSALEAVDNPWYESVTLIRQEAGVSDWAPVIEEANRRLEAFLDVREAVG